MRVDRQIDPRTDRITAFSLKADEGIENEITFQWPFREAAALYKQIDVQWTGMNMSCHLRLEMLLAVLRLFVDRRMTYATSGMTSRQVSW